MQCEIFVSNSLVNNEGKEHNGFVVVVFYRVAFAVGAESGVACAEGNCFAVVAVFGNAGEHVVKLAVTVMYMPAYLAALGQGGYREHTPLVIKLLGLFDEAEKLHIAAAAEKTVCVIDLMLVFSGYHNFTSLVAVPAADNNKKSEQLHERDRKRRNIGHGGGGQHLLCFVKLSTRQQIGFFNGI